MEEQFVKTIDKSSSMQMTDFIKLMETKLFQLVQKKLIDFLILILTKDLQIEFVQQQILLINQLCGYIHLLIILLQQVYVIVLLFIIMLQKNGHQLKLVQVQYFHSLQELIQQNSWILYLKIQMIQELHQIQIIGLVDKCFQEQQIQIIKQQFFQELLMNAKQKLQNQSCFQD